MHYMKVISDLRSEFPIEAIGIKKPENNQGFNGIRTRDLRDAGAMLYQLSYKPHIGSEVNCEFIFYS